MVLLAVSCSTHAYVFAAGVATVVATAVVTTGIAKQELQQQALGGLSLLMAFIRAFCESGAAIKRFPQGV
jgi:hypothetical protein